MYQLIATKYLGEYFVLRQGSVNGVRIPASKYNELRDASTGEFVPTWLVDAARQVWRVDLTGEPLASDVLVRPDTVYGYSRASYELNLGCNYDCEHCYLGLKRFEGLDWPDRERLLLTMRDAGVVWLQLTGGEPLVDRLFREVYTYDPAVLEARSAGTVTERVQLLEQAIATGAKAAYIRPADVAGLSRITELLADPADGLHKIQKSVTEALRRLYMQRNVVMHAGSLSSVTRRATLRSVPSLAGAGMDRLVMAASFAGVTPIHLAARAESELRLLAASAPVRPLSGLLM